MVPTLVVTSAMNLEEIVEHRRQDQVPTIGEIIDSHTLCF